MKIHQTIPNTIGRLLDHLQPSESVVMGVAALLVGLSSGFGIWLFKQLIEWAQWLMFDVVGGYLAPLGAWSVALLPVFGGLIVGAVVHFMIGVERHHGVAGIIESVALAGGRLRYWRIPAKAVASAVSIGSGASVGPEDPSVQIGSNLGSMLGQWFRLSDERVRALVAAGAAAAVASAFNAPIAGVFFALEVILGEISGSALGIVVLASVLSAAFTHAASGPQPAFQVPASEFQSAFSLPLYLGLGLLAGPISAAYVWLLYQAQDIFRGLHAPRWIKPAIAGLIVGVVGIFLPQVFGIGYETIEALLNGQLTDFGLILALLVAKMVLTPTSIGGGFQGGVFAPALFIGSMLGGAYGILMGSLLPTFGIETAAFSMVGMAAVLAGTVHAPLTAIMLLFEMTNDYRIIVPLMFGVTVSLLISQRLQRDSVYMLGLARKGVRIERGRDVEVLDSLLVGEVMRKEFATLNENDPISVAADRLMEMRSHGLPVVNDRSELSGIVSVQDIDKAMSAGLSEHLVGEICTRDVLITYADETLGAALRRMSVRDVGRMPVVVRNNPCQLVGLLRRTDMIRAYDIALTRRTALRHSGQQVRLGIVSGIEVEEALIQPGSACSDKRISEIAWPHECVIATVRRRSQLLIPHGDTLLQPNDVLVFVADGESRQIVQKMCAAS